MRNGEGHNQIPNSIRSCVAAIFLILAAKVGRISAESVDQEGMRSKLKRPRSLPKLNF